MTLKEYLVKVIAREGLQTEGTYFLWAKSKRKAKKQAKKTIDRKRFKVLGIVERQ